jgi:hypothetical protein
VNDGERAHARFRATAGAYEELVAVDAAPLRRQHRRSTAAPQAAMIRLVTPRTLPAMGSIAGAPSCGPT